jgi:His-Xaa-Ser system protein HxsD
MTLESQTDSSPFVFRDSCIHLRIDLRTYRLIAVQKTAYRLADKCTVVLGGEDGQTLPVALTFATAVTEVAARRIAQVFFQELLDQELREQIGLETAPLRALILAHAFSNSDLIRRE